VAKIVRQTAEEFNLEYQQYNTLTDALKAHIQHLRIMANPKTAEFG
jgi:hypothetical protein